MGERMDQKAGVEGEEDGREGLVSSHHRVIPIEKGSQLMACGPDEEGERDLDLRS